MDARKFASGRTMGLPALTYEEHEWLLEAVPSGKATKYEAVVKLKISIPTLNKWLKIPLGERPKLGGRPKGKAPSALASDTGSGRPQPDADASHQPDCDTPAKRSA